MGGQTTRVTLGATVGFIGLGRMGRPMTSRLAAAGYRVQAFDADPEALRVATEPDGIEPAAGAAEAVAGTRAVILMLPNSQIVTDVVLSGLLTTMTRGALLVDMSSSDATETVKLAAVVNEHGVRFLDAPVSGGVPGAQAGTLTIMAGGAEADLADCRPMLQALGQAIRHVGPIGAGHATKALNNLLAATNLLAGVEALLAAERFGLDPEVLLDVVNQSTGGSWASSRNLPNFIVPQTYDSGFSLALLVKDVRMAVGLARAVGARAELGEASVSLWEQAAEALPPDADHTEIARWLADRARAARPAGA